MSLGRRACRPTKVILPFDTAIVDDGSYAAYMESVYVDEGLLTIDPTAGPPVKFTLKQWTDEHKDAISIAENESERAKWKMGVRCSLVGVAGYTIYDVESGLDKPAPVLELKREGRLGEVVPLSWLRDINFPDEHLKHLFIAAHFVSEASVPLSRQSRQESGQAKSESQESSGE